MASASCPARVRRSASVIVFVSVSIVGPFSVQVCVGSDQRAGWPPGHCKRRAFGRAERRVSQVVRGASAAFTARGARKAPRTSTAAIVAKASSGETSSAMVANPRTRSSTI